MICALTLLFAAALPQAPNSAADEARAREDLGQAAKHIDELLLNAMQVRDRAKAALELVRASETKASQADRARLAGLAAELGVKLASLQATVETHAEEIRALRLRIDVEIPPPDKGSVPWFREQVQAARKKPTYAETEKALRILEAELGAEGNKTKLGAASLLGHVRYLLADAIREDSAQSPSGSSGQEVVRLRDASKKLDEVLACPDSTDTGEGSSLHAVALWRKIVIETRLYRAYDVLAKLQSSNASTATTHKKNAEKAWERLTKVFADATLPDGKRVVDVTRAAVDQIR